MIDQFKMRISSARNEDELGLAILEARKAVEAGNITWLQYVDLAHMGLRVRTILKETEEDE